MKSPDAKKTPPEKNAKPFFANENSQPFFSPAINEQPFFSKAADVQPTLPAGQTHGPLNNDALKISSTDTKIQRQADGHHRPTHGPAPSPFLNRQLGSITIGADPNYPVRQHVIPLMAAQEITPPNSQAPFLGFTTAEEARAIAGGHNTVLAVLQTHDGRFHVVDTGRTMPQPTAISFSSISVSAYSSRDFELVRWINLSMATAVPVQEPQNNPQPVSIGLFSPQRFYGYREALVTPVSILADAFGRFAVRNSGLREKLNTINAAISSVTHDNLQLATAYFNYYSSHTLEVADVGNFLALTDGWTKLNARLFDPTEGFTPERLGGILMHEFVHTSSTTQAEAISGNPVEEGRAYGVEYFFAERNHDMTRQRGIGQVVRTGAGEINESLLGIFREKFTKSYATTKILYQLIDNDLAITNAPFLVPNRPTADQARGLAITYISSRSASGVLLQIVNYVNDNYNSILRSEVPGIRAPRFDEHYHPVPQ